MAVGSGVPKGALNLAGAVLGGVAATYEVAEAKDVTHDPSGEEGVVFGGHPVSVRKRGFLPEGSDNVLSTAIARSLMGERVSAGNR